MIHLVSEPGRAAAEAHLDDDIDPGRNAHPATFDPTGEAVVEGEALSAILGRIMITILDAVPIEEVEPSERAAIRRRIDEAMAG